ncbi:unnamed protein product [Allacma fusca]|uniref:GH16 domain-containing protein n=1 Tax=Allacma fusca TaxID=39272 RepID=A0A8J2P7A7_9HEXA|nr:unnamed protein product [Allacma fusca]
MVYIRAVCGLLFLIIFTGIFIYELFIRSKPPWWQGQLAFEDNFNGGYLNFDNWDYAADYSVLPNEKKKITYYSNALNDNIQVYGGTLQLSVSENSQPPPGHVLRSVQIHQKTRGFIHGAFAVRARFSPNRYLASTIRLVQTNACFHNQITIVRRPAEALSNKTSLNNLIFGAHLNLKDKHLANYSTKIVKNVGFSTSNFDLNEDYHDYGVLWTKDKLQWFFDGEQYYEMALDRKEWKISGSEHSSCFNSSAIFQTPMTFVVDLDVYPGFQNVNHTGPVQGLSIDWVRVYQQPKSR